LRSESNAKAFPAASSPSVESRKKKGIINNIKDKDKRTGLDVDMENVNNLFKCLGFIVHSNADLTKKVDKQ